MSRPWEGAGFDLKGNEVRRMKFDLYVTLLEPKGGEDGGRKKGKGKSMGCGTRV